MVAGLPRKLEPSNQNIHSLMSNTFPFVVCLTFFERSGLYIMLLNQMSSNELKQAIDYLKTKLYESKEINGYSHERTIEIKNRLHLYVRRYSNVNKND